MTSRHCGNETCRGGSCPCWDKCRGETIPPWDCGPHPTTASSTFREQDVLAAADRLAECARGALASMDGSGRDRLNHAISAYARERGAPGATQLKPAAADDAEELAKVKARLAAVVKTCERFDLTLDNLVQQANELECEISANALKSDKLIIKAILRAARGGGGAE